MKKRATIAITILASLTLLALSQQRTLSYEPRHASYAQADSTIDWDKMDRSERKDYMRDVLMPKMQALFEAYDSQEFADLKCATCHGDGARTGEFAMPSPQLWKLPKSAAALKALSTNRPTVMKFMTDVLTPEMAKMLGKKPFDPKTKTGFGCGNCHVTAKK